MSQTSAYGNTRRADRPYQERGYSILDLKRCRRITEGRVRGRPCGMLAEYDGSFIYQHGGAYRHHTFKGCFSFGENEWRAIQFVVRQIEFYDFDSGDWWACDGDLARKHGRWEQTPAGLRFLIPVRFYAHHDQATPTQGSLL